MSARTAVVRRRVRTRRIDFGWLGCPRETHNQDAGAHARQHELEVVVGDVFRHDALGAHREREVERGDAQDAQEVHVLLRCGCSVA